ncbi:MAG: hypothetical protein KGS60_14755, partial [Verrucomicrobia bacterium]|nr:hypothetical protein [Verrucomicrobiota bacterium]
MKLKQVRFILFGFAKRNLTGHQVAAAAPSLNPAGLIAILLTCFLGTVSAQFAGERHPGYLGGQTASVEFTSPDANATAGGIPGWFLGVQRTSSPIAGDLHRITVSWSYADNWLPGQETATRSATITAGPHSETIEQAGVDNTYTFSIPS